MLQHKSLTEELNRLITQLIVYAQVANDAGFSDNYAAFEELIREYLNISKGYSLRNANCLQHNYPAIDLIDDQAKVAVQVTSDATAKKIKDTRDQWVKLGYDGYTLVVVGVVKATSSQKWRKETTILTLRRLAREAKSLGIPDLQRLVAAIRGHVSAATYSLTTDEACVANVIDHIERGAIFHLHQMEGSYEKMYLSLEKMRTYILSGEDKDYPVKSKPLSMFAPEPKLVLRAIERAASDIISICDQSLPMGGGFAFNADAYSKMDQLKLDIQGHLADLKRIHSALQGASAAPGAKKSS